MNGLRAGLVGYGSMGRLHYQRLTATPGIEVLAVIDPVLRQGDLDSVPFVGSSLEIVEDMNLDFCVVAIPPEGTPAVLGKLAEYGVPSLIEKPFAVEWAVGKWIADLYESKGLLASVGYIERFNAAVETAREVLNQGRDLGSVLSIDFIRVGPRTHRAHETSAALDLMSHDIDLARFLLDEPLVSFMEMDVPVPSGDVSPAARAFAQSFSGVHLSFLASRQGSGKRREIVICLENGVLELDLIRQSVTLGSLEHGAFTSGSPQLDYLYKHQETWTKVPGSPDGLSRQLNRFVECVRGEAVPIVTLHDALNVLAVLRAGEESKHTRSLVKVG